MRRKNRLAGSTSCELPLPPLCSFGPESAGGTISFSLALSADIAKHFWDSVHYWGGSRTPELMDEVSWAELSLPKSFRSHLGMGSAPAFIHSFALFMNVMPPLLIQSKSGCQALSNLHLPPPPEQLPGLTKSATPPAPLLSPSLLACQVSFHFCLELHLHPGFPRLPAALFLSYFSPWCSSPSDPLPISCNYLSVIPQHPLTVRPIKAGTQSASCSVSGRHWWLRVYCPEDEWTGAFNSIFAYRRRCGAQMCVFHGQLLEAEETGVKSNSYRNKHL